MRQSDLDRLRGAFERLARFLQQLFVAQARDEAGLRRGEPLRRDGLDETAAEVVDALAGERGDFAQFPVAVNGAGQVGFVAGQDARALGAFEELRSSAWRGSERSKTRIERSASARAAKVRSMPSFSTRSSLSRTPAVSISGPGCPR
jgi:hypothetical protein